MTCNIGGQASKSQQLFHHLRENKLTGMIIWVLILRLKSEGLKAFHEKGLVKEKKRNVELSNIKVTLFTLHIIYVCVVVV